MERVIVTLNMAIQVTKTYVPNKSQYMDYISDIFESGWFTNNGKFLQKLESELREYLGVEHLLIVSNGTLALQVLYKTL